MLGLAAIALAGIAIMELERVTAKFTIWANLITWNALVPIGWLLGAIFVFFYAGCVYAGTERGQTGQSKGVKRKIIK